MGVSRASSASPRRSCANVAIVAGYYGAIPPFCSASQGRRGIRRSRVPKTEFRGLETPSMARNRKNSDLYRAQRAASRATGLGERMGQVIERRIRAQLKAKKAPTISELSELARLVAQAQRAAASLVKEVRSMEKDRKRNLDDMPIDERAGHVAELVRELPVEVRHRHGMRLLEEDSKP